MLPPYAYITTGMVFNTEDNEQTAAAGHRQLSPGIGIGAIRFSQLRWH